MAELRLLPRRDRGSGTGEVLDLAEARLVRRARHRDPQALGALWERVVDDAWSVAIALVDEDQAIAVLLAAREALISGAPGLRPDARWVELPFGTVFDELHRRLELPALDSIDGSEWTVPGPPPDPVAVPRDPEAARRAVRFAPPALRLIYLFTLLTPCTLDGIARMAGIRPSVVRHARTAATWRVLRELQK